MSRLLTKARTALAIGLPNIARIAGYRLGVRLGVNPVRRLRAATPRGPFFLRPGQAHAPAPTVPGAVRLFSHWPVTLADPPDWLADPLTGKHVPAPEREWWRIPDFDPETGDIKLVWELSRFDWVIALATEVCAGSEAALRRLEAWLADWCARNPPYRGPNWKCGQEASFRVMHLAMAALVLGQVSDASPGLLELVRLHLRRIAPTLPYALAQDNNHGTSEAAALFIGGSWLQSAGDPTGERWQRAGRRWIEERAARLIGPDGTFSQYSLNYHRVMLDTFCMAEIWRRQLDGPAFSARWYSRAGAAAEWLRHLVDPATGDGPNVGANDGARLLQLSDTDYRDFRPSVQLATVLFAGRRAYAGDGPWDHALHWLGVPLPEQTVAAPRGRLADDGGFAVLRHGRAMALMRYPRFRFRPSQADALHVDLWRNGSNLLRDAGTYGYNTEPCWFEYFGGTAGHNTVQFDGRDQMPRLSRFLFGDWLRTSSLEPLNEDVDASRFAAGYRDQYGAGHRRRIVLGDESLLVEDEITGFADNAVLRWRLAPGEWQLDGRVLRHGRHTLMVQASVPIERYELVQGWESRHYLEKTPVPVLEVEVRQPGLLTSEYRWTS